MHSTITINHILGDYLNLSKLIVTNSQPSHLLYYHPSEGFRRCSIFTKETPSTIPFTFQIRDSKVRLRAPFAIS